MKFEINKTVKPTVDTVIHPTFKSKIDKSATNLVMDMLAKIYNNPFQAVIREYVSNAVDSHKAVNQTKPVQVHLPSGDDRLFSVRDYGEGLDAFDIMTIYANFGTSNKRDSDEFIGGFGIGSKSGLAVSDKIHITSWKNGKRNKFLIKRTDEGIVTQFIEENISEPNVPSGTLVEVFFDALWVEKKVTSYGFESSTGIAQYITPIAGWSNKDVIVDCSDDKMAKEINSKRIPDVWVELEHGFISNETCFKNYINTFNREYVVGNVFYKNKSMSDSDNLIQNIFERDDFPKNLKPQIQDFINKQNFVLKLDIGSTKVNYAREQILWESSESTRKHICEQLVGLYNDVAKSIKTLQDLNLDKDTYLSKVKNLGIFLNFHGTNKNSSYENLILNTPNYKISKTLDVNNAEFNITSSKKYDFIRSRSNGLYSELDLNLGKSMFITTDAADENAKNRVSRNITQILKNEQYIQSPILKEICEYQNQTDTGDAYIYQNTKTYIVIAEKSACKIPTAFKEHILKLEDIKAAWASDKKNVPQLNKKSSSSSSNDPNAVLKSQKVYYHFYNDYYSESSFLPLATAMSNIKSSYSPEKFILIPHDSAFAFTARKSNFAMDFLVKALMLDGAVCAKNKIDFKRMQNEYPNAMVLDDDDAIIRKAANLIASRQWIDEDDFAISMMSIMIYNIKVDDVDPVYETVMKFGIWNDDLKFRKSKCHFEMFKKMNDSMKKLSVNDAIVDKILSIVKSVPVNNRAHKVTTDFKILKAITLSQHNNFEFTRAEIDHILDNIKSQYSYEISELKKFYA